jgi:diguanylate cyclase (GGDEF)-like protein
MGHVVTEASDGAWTLECLRREPVDLVLLDVQMPCLDGFATAREIREIQGNRWLPIIFLSARETDADVEKGILAGGDDYLVKPVSPVVLGAKIRALQRIHDMQRQTVEMSERLAAANRELAQLARQDGLTGVANRHHFDQRLAEEIARARHHRSPLGLVLGEVDDFKAYKTTTATRRAMPACSASPPALSSVCRRATDLVARYGGEEFALVLPDTDMTGVEKVSNAARERVEALAISPCLLPRFSRDHHELRHHRPRARRVHHPHPADPPGQPGPLPGQARRTQPLRRLGGQPGRRRWTGRGPPRP